MQVTQDKQAGSRINLTIKIEADQVKKTYEKALRYLTQNVQIKGFRKGKAPRNLVIRQVGQQRVIAGAIDDLINDSVKQALDQTEIRPITQFELETGIEDLVGGFSPDADFTFSGYVEVYPEAEVGQYSNLTVSVKRIDTDPTEVDTTIQSWLEQRATLVPVENRPAQMGDSVVVDFVGYDQEGQKLEDTEATDFQMDLKEGAFLPGFVENIASMQLDETKDIETEFPDDYFVEALAGQPVKFTVTLHEIKEKELPELTDELVQDMTDLDTIAELKDKLSARLERDAYAKNQDAVEEAILAAILETTQADLPESLIQQETQVLIRQALNTFKGQGMDFDVNRLLDSLPQNTLDSLKAKHRPEAIERLRRSLALSAIVNKEQIEVGHTELEMAVREFLRQPGAEKLNIKRVQEYIHEDLLSTKVINWLKEQTTVNWTDAEGNAVEPPVAPSEVEPTSTVPEAEFTEATPDEIETTASEVSSPSEPVATLDTSAEATEIPDDHTSETPEISESEDEAVD